MCVWSCIDYFCFGFARFRTDRWRWRQQSGTTRSAERNWEPEQCRRRADVFPTHCYLHARSRNDPDARLALIFRQYGPRVLLLLILKLFITLRTCYLVLNTCSILDTVVSFIRHYDQLLTLFTVVLVMTSFPFNLCFYQVFSPQVLVSYRHTIMLKMCFQKVNSGKVGFWWHFNDHHC